MATVQKLEHIRLKVLKLKQMHEELQLQNEQLAAQVERLQSELAIQKNRTDAAEESNKMLKLAQPITLSSTEIQEKKKILDEFISDIDQCIRLLSDQ